MFLVRVSVELTSRGDYLAHDPGPCCLTKDRFHNPSYLPVAGVEPVND